MPYIVCILCFIQFCRCGSPTRSPPRHDHNIILLFSMGPRSAINSLNIYDILLSRRTPIICAIKNDSRCSAIALRRVHFNNIITVNALRRMLRMPDVQQEENNE